VANACQHESDGVTLPVELYCCSESTCVKPSSCGGSFGTRSGALTTRHAAFHGKIRAYIKSREQEHPESEFATRDWLASLHGLSLT
jgi:hypothetical protein